jgi:cysteine desulfurase / selenocysteine lyase
MTTSIPTSTNVTGGRTGPGIATGAVGPGFGVHASAAVESAVSGPLDTSSVERLRGDFPILARKVHGKPLVYLDNAATTQKPGAVINAVSGYYEHFNANIHRGVHTLSQEATAAYERAREAVARFINAPRADDVIFTRGCTESLNLVARSYGGAILRPGDEILLTGLEHHANIVPWQLVAEAAGARVVAVPLNERGEVPVAAFAAALSPRTRIAAFAHVSNALGTINPVAEFVALARGVGAVSVVDGAQAAPHLPVDVQALGCDFYAFSGHKVYGPTGIGALYGRAGLLAAMPPWIGGGDMIDQVTFEKTTFAEPPARFEAGTPPIAEAIGLAAAIDYLEAVGLARAAAWEDHLLAYATEQALTVPGLRVIGTARLKASVLSFVVDGLHALDIGMVLDRQGIAVRTGHHCAQPVMRAFNLPATARASFSFYNTEAEVDALIKALHAARRILLDA